MSQSLQHTVTHSLSQLYKVICLHSGCCVLSTQPCISTPHAWALWLHSDNAQQLQSHFSVQGSLSATEGNLQALRLYLSGLSGIRASVNRQNARTLYFASHTTTNPWKMSKLNLSMNLSASSANVIRLTVYTLLLSRELVPFTANLCSSLQKHIKKKKLFSLQLMISYIVPNGCERISENVVFSCGSMRTVVSQSIESRKSSSIKTSP